jgi:glycosyltransferase involved in cell wall biosynthesis
LEDVVRVLPPAFEVARIQAYIDADVFAVAATTYEETSLAALEAVAAGTPCVLTKQCAVPGLEAVGGGIITDCNPEAFAAGLCQMLSSPGRKRAALAAREIVLTSQTTEARADLVAELFRDIAGVRTRMPHSPAVTMP